MTADKPDVAAIAGRLSEAQQRLVLESDPDDITGREGCGVPIRGPQYRTAKSLREVGCGYYSHGFPSGDLYFNSRLGLAVRNHLMEKNDVAK